MRILVVSHCMIPREVRKRLDAVAAHPQVSAVQVVVPTEWREPLSTLRLADHVGGPGIDGGGEGVAHSVVGLPVRFGGHPGVYTFAGLDSVVREFRPDVVHCDSEPWSLAAVQTLRAARRSMSSPIFTVYTCDNMAIPLRPWSLWARRRIYARADGLLCMSTEAVEFAHANGFGGASIVCPLVGVDPESFRPAPRTGARAALGLPERFTIGFVGRLVPEKGVTTLMEAFLELKAKVDIEGGPTAGTTTAPAKTDDGPEAQLLFLGRGPLAEEIVAQAQDAGLADRVTVADTVPHGEVPRWLSAMDVLVLPSREDPGRWKEQFGHVIIEAMSSGCAVVGSGSGAIPEVIGDAGIIFPEGDASALAVALHRLHSNAAERERLCIMGHKRVSEHYTHQVVAGTMVDFWASLRKEGR